MHCCSQQAYFQDHRCFLFAHTGGARGTAGGAREPVKISCDAVKCHQLRHYYIPNTSIKRSSEPNKQKFLRWCNSSHFRAVVKLLLRFTGHDLQFAVETSAMVNQPELIVVVILVVILLLLVLLLVVCWKVRQCIYMYFAPSSPISSCSPRFHESIS